MTQSLPPVLATLLASQDSTLEERAWAAFLEEYSGLILHVIRRTERDYDVVMDRYAYVLDALRRDRCRRLHGFASEGRGKFTTWLVAVVRRLCVDEYRARYGRPQSEGAAWQEERRTLADLVGDELALERLEASAPLPDSYVIAKESCAALGEALAELDPQRRLILRLRFEDDLSVPEIARLLRYDSPFRLYREIEKTLAGLRRALTTADVRGGTL